MNNNESFEDGVTHLMVMMEELKRSIASASSHDQEIMQLDAIVGRLDFLYHKRHDNHHPADDDDDDVTRDIYDNCRQRAILTARHVLERTVAPNAQTNLVFDDHVEGQAAVARMTELTLVLYTMTDQEENNNNNSNNNNNNNNSTTKEVIDLYANYQKQLLRQRAKPAIAHLANWRSSSDDQRAAAAAAAHDNHDHDDDDDHEEAITQPHSHALTSILGHASALIHPLQQWKEALPPESSVSTLCTTSIQILNQQTQTLVKTIANWFLDDKKVEQWMQQANNTAQILTLAELDALVEEMAFSCQLMARYTALISDSSVSTIEQELLPEWTWKYASLERFLGVQQLQSALQLATPVDIVIGSSIKVPSVVEDAQYLSTRALDRSMSTRNSQAMGTVAHSLSHDIWSTDNVDVNSNGHSAGVYSALLNNRGCYAERRDESTTTTATAKDAPKTGDFASALLDALDEDLKTKKTPPPSSAPSGGGFLGSLMGSDELQQIRLETQLCALNGIYSASTACQSLVESLDTWLEEQDDRMIGLAREELMRYAQAYTTLLQQQVVQTIHEWCGSIDGGASLKGKCLHALRDFVHQEQYQLDNAAFTKAEADDRLEAVLLTPLKESKLISQLNRCESEVALAICQELSKQVADLIVQSLWQTEKRFTDWGSLLLSKQVRLLQTYMMGLLGDDAAPQQQQQGSPSFSWEQLSQVVTILQLERPSDWSIYQSTSVLTTGDLRQTLSMRVDFSPDAIFAVCQAQNKAAQENS